MEMFNIKLRPIYLSILLHTCWLIPITPIINYYFGYDIVLTSVMAIMVSSIIIPIILPNRYIKSLSIINNYICILVLTIYGSYFSSHLKHYLLYHMVINIAINIIATILYRKLICFFFEMCAIIIEEINT